MVKHKTNELKNLQFWSSLTHNKQYFTTCWYYIGLDEESASSQAYSLILPKLQKDLESIYLERLLWMRQLRKNRVHRKVMNTRDAFINSDDFDHDEALEAAVDKRKFLLKRLLKDNTFILIILKYLSYESLH